MTSSEEIKTEVKDEQSEVKKEVIPKVLKGKFFECEETLQIVDIRNITKPTRAFLDVEEQTRKHPNRTLVITLSDGINKCRCIELSPLQVLNKVLPGMEVRLKGRVPVCSGFLILEEGNFEIVGRPNEQMVREWRAAQNRAYALSAGFGTSAPVFQALTREMLRKQKEDVSSIVASIIKEQEQKKQQPQPKSVPVEQNAKQPTAEEKQPRHEEESKRDDQQGRRPDKASTPGSNSNGSKPSVPVVVVITDVKNTQKEEKKKIHIERPHSSSSDVNPKSVSTATDKQEQKPEQRHSKLTIIRKQD